MLAIIPNSSSSNLKMSCTFISKDVIMLLYGLRLCSKQRNTRGKQDIIL